MAGNEFEEGFDDLLEAIDESCDAPQFVRINGQKARAIIEDITTDEILLAGGVGESGGFRAKVRKSDFADPPQQGDEITGRGKILHVLSVIERNGVEYEVTAGDLTSDDV